MEEYGIFGFNTKGDPMNIELERFPSLIVIDPVTFFVWKHIHESLSHGIFGLVLKPNQKSHIWAHLINYVSTGFQVFSTPVDFLNRFCF